MADGLEVCLSLHGLGIKTDIKFKSQMTSQQRILVSLINEFMNRCRHFGQDLLPAVNIQKLHEFSGSLERLRLRLQGPYGESPYTKTHQELRTASRLPTVPVGLRSSKAVSPSEGLTEAGSPMETLGLGEDKVVRRSPRSFMRDLNRAAAEARDDFEKGLRPPESSSSDSDEDSFGLARSPSPASDDETHQQSYPSTEPARDRHGRRFCRTMFARERSSSAPPASEEMLPPIMEEADGGVAEFPLFTRQRSGSVPPSPSFPLSPSAEMAALQEHGLGAVRGRRRSNAR